MLCTAQNTCCECLVRSELAYSYQYGLLTLLCVIVSMPAMVATSTMDPESVGIVRDYVNELML